jgi:hypothetical protein
VAISCIQLAFRYDDLVVFSFTTMAGASAVLIYSISGIYLYPLHLSNLLQILGRYDGKLHHLS